MKITFKYSLIILTVTIQLILSLAVQAQSCSISHDGPKCTGEYIGFTITSGDITGNTLIWKFFEGADCYIINSDGYSNTAKLADEHKFGGKIEGTYANPRFRWDQAGTFAVELSIVDPGANFAEGCVTPVSICECCSESYFVPGVGNDILGNTLKFTDFGEFKVNPNNGRIVYQRNNCPETHPYDCVIDSRTEDPVEVVSASAVTFKDNWPYREDIYLTSGDVSNANVYETGERGKWRPESQFVYREHIRRDKNFNSGTFPLIPFDWSNDITGNIGVNNLDKWVLTSTTTKYTPNGEPIEDVNILNIKSTAKYGYNHTLPVLVAQNAGDRTVAFESYENIYQGAQSFEFEDGLQFDQFFTARDNTLSHTGQFSLLITPSPFVEYNRVAAGELRLSQQMADEGLMMRFWIHTPKDKAEPDGKLRVYYLYLNQEGHKEMYKISRAGEWALYEGMIPASELAALRSDPQFNEENTLLTMQVGIKFGGTSAFDTYEVGDVHIDDVRIQPIQAEMVCYVYDQAQRLTAVLDDQHFAMIYQYNTEGILTGKLKETVEGIKPISKTHYNSKGEQRQ